MWCALCSACTHLFKDQGSAKLECYSLFIGLIVLDEMEDQGGERIYERHISPFISAFRSQVRQDENEEKTRRYPRPRMQNQKYICGFASCNDIKSSRTKLL